MAFRLLCSQAVREGQVVEQAVLVAALVPWEDAALDLGGPTTLSCCSCLDSEYQHPDCQQ